MTSQSSGADRGRGFAGTGGGEGAAVIPGRDGRTYVTAQQAVVHALFLKHRSMSVVARQLGISQIRVREALVQHQRNVLRDAGANPPPLREMLKGDVAMRFGIPKEEIGGRPATHPQPDLRTDARADRRPGRVLPRPAGPVSRLLVTAVEPGRPVHGGFARNLEAFAAHVGAERVVAVAGQVTAEIASRFAGVLADADVDLAGVVDLAIDERPPARLAYPLDAMRHRDSARWTIVVSPAVQMETPPRFHADPARFRLTTGAMTMPPNFGPAGSRQLGAVVVEVLRDGRAHCRHLTADPAGDGTFQDLDVLVEDGRVRTGCGVEAVTFGDIHHAHLDAEVAASTWGIGASNGGSCLVDRLRPRFLVFHDVCDFDACNPHHRNDHLRRFARLVAGGGDVRRELAAASGFLSVTRRAWAESIVVGSNHDDWFVRWLRETDFRDDPVNAEFFLESALSLHRRVAGGAPVEGFFESVLRGLSADGLDGVRFLGVADTMRIAGTEASIHGHLGIDGRPGDLRTFEKLGLRATLGHTHRPTTRDGVYCAGVSASDLEYARGPVTAWAPGHVVTYATGARQHLVLQGGAFHA